MTESREKLKLIVATPVAAGEEVTDRGGVATHSLPGFFGGTVAKVTEIDPAQLRDDIDKCLAEMKEIFTNLKRPAMQGWKLEQINVGLTISAEGSVGVATAGVEASIEIAFVPEK